MESFIFTAETHAIVLALDIILKSKHKKFIIFSDSLSVLLSLRKKNLENPLFNPVFQVRNSALTLADMNAFHQEKMEEQERVRNETDEIEAELKK